MELDLIGDIKSHRENMVANLEQMLTRQRHLEDALDKIRSEIDMQRGAIRYAEVLDKHIEDKKAELAEKPKKQRISVEEKAKADREKKAAEQELSEEAKAKADEIALNILEPGPVEEESE